LKITGNSEKPELICNSLATRIVPSAPKISIVTPTFNAMATLRETIESVLAQDYKNWEHIVMDGGSTDGTVDLLKGFPHLKWTSEKDHGHWHAMNKGIERASGEIVAILNADDCYREGALQKVADAFVTHPEWDGLFGDIVYVDGESREIFRRAEACFDYDVLRFGNHCYVIHPTLFVRKSVYEKFGAYRYDKFLNSCDFDFILRLGRNRCRIGHIPFAVVNYRFHAHGQSADRRVSSNMWKESLVIRKEHGRPDGIAGRVLQTVFRIKRQLQKLIYRGRPDFIPGKWFLRKHMHDKTTFSSNVGVDKL
jgi:glycosyltransferase involved in cell wall biosynthesis